LLHVQVTAASDEGVRWRAYTATLEKIDAFTLRFVALAQAHGSERARELVVLGDGAEWIWNLCAQHFPRAVQIVDYWHMTQHLYTVAQARFGKGTPEAEAWVRESQWYLDRDLTATVMARIREWQPEDEAGRKARDTEHGYFANNQERMRYETFLKHGYQIGSGVVEAACRQVVTQRLDESGMHWREASAEAVLAIRARLKSSAPTDLRYRRRKQPAYFLHRTLRPGPLQGACAHNDARALEGVEPLLRAWASGSSRAMLSRGRSTRRPSADERDVPLCERERVQRSSPVGRGLPPGVPVRPKSSGPTMG